MPLFPRRLAAVVLSALALCAGLVTPSANAIVGGSLATPPSWLAAIGTPAFLIRPSGQFCGGVLVASDKVVTAAHCVSFLRQVPGLLSAVFGRADLSKKDGETVKITKIWVHPDFRETSFQSETVEHNDVAVLTLARPVNRLPLPLIGRYGTYPPGADARVLGWGTTSERDLFNVRLRDATIPIAPDKRCTTAYGRDTFSAKDMVCAGSPKADTCEFDSGGPLILQGRLAGLTSWAYGCARPGYPGVYTRLSAFTLPL
ncbi:S1 family peptidase [Actinoallomurus sp. CA-150999]|uniref:S1 family peptidase n=1 Tax=Actinoallomurus sp. CA-150999 TaxID=3239887 RepID=UPI003D94C6D9